MLITNKRLLLPSLFEDTMATPPATFPLAGWDLYSNKDINTATSHWRRGGVSGGYAIQGHETSSAGYYTLTDYSIIKRQFKASRLKGSFKFKTKVWKDGYNSTPTATFAVKCFSDGTTEESLLGGGVGMVLVGRLNSDSFTINLLKGADVISDSTLTISNNTDYFAKFDVTSSYVKFKIWKTTEQEPADYNLVAYTAVDTHNKYLAIYGRSVNQHSYYNGALGAFSYISNLNINLFI